MSRKGSEGTGDTGGSLYGWQKAVREGRLDAFNCLEKFIIYFLLFRVFKMM